MLLLRDIRLAVSRAAISHPRIDFAGQHPADLVCGWGLVFITVLYICYGFAFGKAGEILPENVFCDHPGIFIFYKPFILYPVSEGNRAA